MLFISHSRATPTSTSSSSRRKDKNEGRASASSTCGGGAPSCVHPHHHDGRELHFQRSDENVPGRGDRGPGDLPNPGREEDIRRPRLFHKPGRRGPTCPRTPASFPQRIINAVQMLTARSGAEPRAGGGAGPVRGDGDDVMEKIERPTSGSTPWASPWRASFTAVTPIPEIAKALEAEYREILQKKADEAIYSRAACAVEQERIIKTTS